jgi:hypothetical protein
MIIIEVFVKHWRLGESARRREADAYVHCDAPGLVVKTSDTIRPYKPKTSAKIRIKIMPTYRRGCCAVPRTPASPTIPIAKPAARPDRPTLRPAPR